MNSCTSALLVGLLACEIGPGDEVIVPGYTFVAPIAAVAYTGATAVLAEIDESLTLDPEDVRQKITRRTKAVIAVHMLGVACNMDALTKLAKEHGVLLIEDCAQAAGGSFRNRALGTFGKFGAFSLNVFKTFTAGDGGVLCTDDEELFRRAFAIHDHGTRPYRLGVADDDALLGLNLRMHELTGAVAGVQLARLAGILKRLRDNRAVLREAIGVLPAARERPDADPDGSCATVICYTFRTVEMATRAGQAVSTMPLSRSGKHNYANIPQLGRPVRRLGVASTAAPSVRNHQPGALPRTDEILARTLGLSVGVVDSYLGTGIGVRIVDSQESIKAFGQAVRRRLTEVLP
jgi:dTDP-4-amino-4,6-dideoxygalactose transaminase